jgi:hypothetical protein
MYWVWSIHGDWRIRVFYFERRNSGPRMKFEMVVERERLFR